MRLMCCSHVCLIQGRVKVPRTSLHLLDATHHFTALCSSLRVHRELARYLGFRLLWKFRLVCKIDENTVQKHVCTHITYPVSLWASSIVAIAAHGLFGIFFGDTTISATGPMGYT